MEISYYKSVNGSIDIIHLYPYNLVKHVITDADTPAKAKKILEKELEVFNNNDDEYIKEYIKNNYKKRKRKININKYVRFDRLVSTRDIMKGDSWI